MDPRPTFFQRLGRLLVGRARSTEDRTLFHSISLIAVFAWVGLGADGLSSLCYGPEEAFLTLTRHAQELGLGSHPHLILFVGLASLLTVLIISAGYSQLIEAFPTGGGGYLVASKMLSPAVGMVSGCALLVDYVLTITISTASSADFLFSFVPAAYANLKLPMAVVGLLLLMWLNLRGVKESVVPLVVPFAIFVFTHGLAIAVAIAQHAMGMPELARQTVADIHHTINHPSIGLLGMLALLLRAYSTGAGTYTGIEAVSNGLQILREPRVQTGKRTMRYMAASLAIGVMGLMVVYVLMGVNPDRMYASYVRSPSGALVPLEQGATRTPAELDQAPGALGTFEQDLGEALSLTAQPVGEVVHVKVKTLNAVVFEEIFKPWTGPWHYVGQTIIWLALASSAAILLIAAQAGFLGGPRVLANMALDSWLPKRFASLSDRFVAHNGVLLMSGAALITMLATGGSVTLLVVLYSINVFITFSLSQAGMVRYWWMRRSEDQPWKKGMWINGVGFIITAFILITLVVIKFEEGGWVTLLVTGALIGVVVAIKRHYRQTAALLKRLDGLVRVAEPSNPSTPAGVKEPAQTKPEPQFDPESKTAVVLVNGFSGVGLHTLFTIVRLFSGIFKNFVFIQVGAVDAGVFKGADEIEALKKEVALDAQRYVRFMQSNGYYAEAHSSIGVDVVDEATTLAAQLQERFPKAVFFGGQLVFPTDSFINRLLHNYTVFALQRKFYLRGIPFVILPIRV